MQEARSDIHLHIERLVLEGLPIERSESAIVQATVEAELARLLSENGIAAQFQAGGAVPQVRGDALQLSSSSPDRIGQQIARSVYGGIGTLPRHNSERFPSIAGGTE
jgi:hypothetical protein